jgi:hypothetical protein
MNPRAKIMAAEAMLWADRLAVLKAGLDYGKPDAIQKIMAEIERLDGEIYALRARNQITGTGSRAEAGLLVEIAAKEARVAQLRALLTSVKLAPREADEGPTPEVAARPSRRDAILSLALNGTISWQQMMAARMIARIFEAIARAGQARIGRLDTAGRGSRGYREVDLPDEIDALRSQVYLPWCSGCSRRSLDIAIKVSVYGIALDRVRRKHRIGWKAAVADLEAALDGFSLLESRYRRECAAGPGPDPTS